MKKIASIVLTAIIILSVMSVNGYADINAEVIPENDYNTGATTEPTGGEPTGGAPELYIKELGSLEDIATDF